MSLDCVSPSSIYLHYDAYIGIPEMYVLIILLPNEISSIGGGVSWFRFQIFLEHILCPFYSFGTYI